MSRGRQSRGRAMCTMSLDKVVARSVLGCCVRFGVCCRQFFLPRRQLTDVRVMFFPVCTISVSDFALDSLSSSIFGIFRSLWFQSIISKSCVAKGSRFRFAVFLIFHSGFFPISFSNFALGLVAILIRRVHPMNFDVLCFVRVFYPWRRR